ncbi:acetyltransferase [Paenibacillus glycanilyticus]|uniref:acyltransferase family protein n=1 Tax=Paenibacillus glycanilyticus TaxID=126569 RepID=UPI002040B9F1|nr:acyltransferase family protein [Paenibacillus glycanilyticus]MCM3629179.1 acetyltransferase [Paenibacillus glycanilyticus]
MPQTNNRYMPGLDGVRAIAVIAVIAYHFGWPVASGGLLGVGVFFVLSGYLITDLLLEERRSTGRIHFRRFWIRRSLRLLPAMLLMLLAITVYLALADRGRLSDICGEMLSALTYTSNWYLIYRQVSYFESFGPLSPIGHLWSLAVEEQFYLVWPLLLWGMIRFIPFPTRGKLAVVTLTAAAASLIAMAFLYVPGTDPSRVYYGTDTRAFGLFIGAAFAIFIPSRKLAEPLGRRSVVLDAIGAIGLCISLLMITSVDKYDDSLYRGGMFVLSMAAGLVIVASASPFSLIGKLLSWKPLRWIGIRSYGIYLWHYPVQVLMSSSKGPYEDSKFLYQLAQLIMIVLIAALSYRYFEQPLRSGKLFKYKKKEKQNMKSKSMKKGIRMITLPAILMIVMICAACEGAGNNQPAHSIQPTTETNANETGTTSDSTPSPTPSGTGEPTSSIPTNTQDSGGVTAVGDSVMVGVKAELEKLIPGIVIDGKVSRQLSDAIEVVSLLKSENKLGHAVVIELGTNGPFTAKKLNELLKTIGDDKRVYLVNTNVPRDWQDTVNKTLAEAAKEHSNVKLIDWRALSSGKSDWFTKDGVHLQPKGAEAYAKLIADTIG